MKNEIPIRLTGTRIMVRPPVVEETTKGGIVIPQITKEKEERASTTGVLVAAAAEAWKCKEMTGVKIGDNLFYARYSGDNVPFTYKGINYKVMNAPDVVGILDEEPDSQFQSAQSTTEVFGLADKAA